MKRRTIFVVTAAVAGMALLAASGLATPRFAAGAICMPGELSGRVRMTERAAGTTLVGIVLRNVSSQRCVLGGFAPRMTLRDDAGPLATRLRHGGLSILDRPVRNVVLRPGDCASLLVAFANVPQGEGTCGQASELRIWIPRRSGLHPCSVRRRSLWRRAAHLAVPRRDRIRVAHPIIRLGPGPSVAAGTRGREAP
jgi:hypothetical protein